MRVFKIDEQTQDSMMAYIFESVSPKATQVRIIRDFLDANFRRQSMDDIDGDGKPIKIYAVTQINVSGDPIRDMEMKDLLLYLDDQFHKVISRDSDRKIFLKQVITDWYNNAITKDGLLSVNYIR